ncbi:MAG: hypothetical protein R8M37_00310 [Alphaproteobacteria bacterium]|nr:hypothetical protein [Alphaproteobacteria bacterium]
MKVKNIMFTGFMAAILGATSANAVDAAHQLISKQYADNKLQAKLTQDANAGDNVTITNGRIGVNLSEYAKTTDVNSAVSGVQGEVDALETKVGTIPQGATATDIVGYVQEKTAGIATNENLAELTERVAANETSLKEGGATANAIAAALKAGEDAQTDINTLNQTLATNDTIAKANAAQTAADVSAAVTNATKDLATKASVTDLAATVADKADKTALDAYRTSGDQDVIDNAIKASITDITEDGGTIDTKVGAATANLATKSSVTDLETSLDGRLDTLEAIDHSKYATTEALTAVETVANAAATKETVNGINTRLQTAEGEIDTLQSDVDTIEANALLQSNNKGDYIVTFDEQGNPEYTQIQIVLE